MKKTDRLELFEKGIRILRDRYDHHTKSFRIYEYSKNGGWIVYLNDVYESSKECISAMNKICEENKNFVVDNPTT